MNLLPADHPVPPLRAGVRREPRPDDAEFPAVLVDEVLEQRIRLDRLGQGVADRLDRPQTFAELAARVRAEVADGADTAERVAESVLSFRRLFLFDDERAAAAIAERRAADRWLTASVADVPLLVLPDARFDCTCCGGCCGGHNVGPVDAHVTARLATPEGAAFLADAGIAPDEVTVSAPIRGHSTGNTVLRTCGGWCVFLDDAAHCRLHAAFGAESKPSVCRLFPFTFVLRPEGVAVSLQMECRDVIAAVRTGRPLAAQDGELRTLLRLPQDLPRVRPAYVLDGMATLPYKAYAGVRDALLADLAEPVADPTAALAALAARLDRDGGPLAEGPREGASRVDGVGDLRDMLHEMVQRMGRSLVELRRKLFVEDAGNVVRLTSLDRVLAGLSRLVPAFDRVVQPPRDPDARELFRLLARNALQADELGAARSLRHGMAQLAFRWLLARAIAFDRAHDVKRHEPTAQDHIDGLVCASFALRSPRMKAVLQAAAAPMLALFVDHLPALREDAAELAVKDTRAEFYLI